MSSNRSSSGGVRNLRAMFENGGGASDTTTPLERGRSPAGSEGAARSDANTPRPLSKVRTSFVAIERSGQLGLQLGVTKEKDGEAPVEAAVDKQKQTNGLGEIKEVEALKKLPEASNGNLVKSAPEKPGSATIVPPDEKAKTDTEPQTTTSAVKSAKTTKAPSSISAPEKPVAVDTKQPPKSEEQSRPSKPATAASANPVKLAEKVEPQRAKGTTAEPKAKPQASVSKSDKDHPTPDTSTRKTATKPPAAPQESSSRSAPAPIATSKGPAKGTQPSNAPKPVTKTPNSAKPTTTEMAPPPRAPNTNSDHKGKKPAPPADSSKPSTISKPQGATPAKARSRDAPPKEVKRPKEISLETGPFVKPKPKSPTRPVQLPASATAPTAAWAAKIAPEEPKGISRSPSRSTATKTLRRQPSKVNADRPALGRPRESAASDLRRQPCRHSLPAHRLPNQPSRPSIAGSGAGAGAGTGASGVDDGFLARMMRPTASSASKTHEKPAELKPATTTTLKPRVAKAKSGSFGSEAARSDRSASASVHGLQEGAAAPVQAVHKDVPLLSIETDGGAAAAAAETESEVEIKVESEAGDALEGVPPVESEAAGEPAREAVAA